MSLQEIIVFVIVLLAVAWIVYKRFIKKKGGCGCDTCTADCKMRDLVRQKRQDCPKCNKN
jgi:hypothetical protein